MGFASLVGGWNWDGLSGGVFCKYIEKAMPQNLYHQRRHLSRISIHISVFSKEVRIDSISLSFQDPRVG